MAGKVGLSEAAVRRRVSNLVKEGTIKKFTIEVSEPQLHQRHNLRLGQPCQPTSEVSKKIRAVKGVETIYETTGPFDIAAIIKGSGYRRGEQVRGGDSQDKRRPQHKHDDSPAERSADFRTNTIK